MEFDPIIGLGALAAFFTIVGAGSILWPRLVKAHEDYIEASEYIDPVGSAIIAAAGGVARREERMEYTHGITSEAHDFLGLTKAKYEKGVKTLACTAGFCVGLVFLLLSASIVAGVFLGLMFTGLAYFLVTFAENDKINQRKAEQVRQFPFFLDIFLLMVQSNGNIEDAIETYTDIFGFNEIASELVILREDLKSHSLLDGFERLRNRVGDENLRNVLGELTQKLRTGTDLQTTLEQQSEDMRTLREELGAQAAERLNAKFAIPVVLAALATLMIFLAPAVAQMVDTGFL